MILRDHPKVWLKQKFELAELFGFETRNKYQVLDAKGQALGFLAEQQKGWLGFLFRQFLGHWRRFELHLFDLNRQTLIVGKHRFRIFFQRLEVYNPAGDYVGAVQRKFAIFSKKFILEDARGQEIYRVSSPFWRLWTFKIETDGQERAFIRKKWSGLLTEIFTDKESFLVEYQDASISENERRLMLMAAVYVDLMYFEAKA